MHKTRSAFIRDLQRICAFAIANTLYCILASPYICLFARPLHPSSALHPCAADRAVPHFQKAGDRVVEKFYSKRRFISFLPSLSLGLISLLFHRIHRPAIRLHPLASPTSAPSSGSCVHLQQFGSSVKLFPPPLHARAKSPCPSF